jgi:hypothetical protein
MLGSQNRSPGFPYHTVMGVLKILDLYSSQVRTSQSYFCAWVSNMFPGHGLFCLGMRSSNWSTEHDSVTKQLRGTYCMSPTLTFFFVKQTFWNNIFE